MRDHNTIELSPAEIDAIVAEALRRALGLIIERKTWRARAATPRSTRGSPRWKRRWTALRRAARRNDVALVDDWCREAADAVSVTMPQELPPALGRKALHLKADIATVEARVEDGEDALRLAQPLIAPFSKASVVEFVKRPVLLSAAFDKAIALQTKPSMLNSACARPAPSSLSSWATFPSRS